MVQLLVDAAVVAERAVAVLEHLIVADWQLAELVGFFGVGRPYIIFVRSCYKVRKFK